MKVGPDTMRMLVVSLMKSIIAGDKDRSLELLDALSEGITERLEREAQQD